MQSSQSISLPSAVHGYPESHKLNQSNKSFKNNILTKADLVAIFTSRAARKSMKLVVAVWLLAADAVVLTHEEAAEFTDSVEVVPHMDDAEHIPGIPCAFVYGLVGRALIEDADPELVRMDGVEVVLHERYILFHRISPETEGNRLLEGASQVSVDISDEYLNNMASLISAGLCRVLYQPLETFSISRRLHSDQVVMCESDGVEQTQRVIVVNLNEGKSVTNKKS